LSQVFLKKKILKIFDKNKDNVFLINSLTNEEVTYGAFLNKTQSLLKYFHSIGLTPNSNILISKKNSEDYLVTFLACCLGGYKILPVDPGITQDRIDSIFKVINFDYIINNKTKFSFTKNSTKFDKKFYLKDHDFLMISSSGTQSEEFKAIVFNSKTFLESSYSFSKLTKYNKNNTLLHCLPMFYMAGILNTFFSSIFSENKIILTNRFSIFNISEISEICSAYKINTFHLTPDMYRSLYKTLNQKSLIKLFKNSKSIVSTGSILHEEIKSFYLKKIKKQIYSCYGLTELGGPLTIQNKSNFYEKNSVGIHDEKIKFKIKKNEILINSVFKAKYFLSISGKKKFKVKNKFYGTGDLGYYKNKQLFITGRNKDIIKKGGEIVSLSLVESVFLSRDDILEVAAVPASKIKNNACEENYVLFLTMNEKYHIEKKIDELELFYKKKLRKIEYPKKMIVVGSMPKTSNGKIKKNSLINLFSI